MLGESWIHCRGTKREFRDEEWGLAGGDHDGDVEAERRRGQVRILYIAMQFKDDTRRNVDLDRKELKTENSTRSGSRRWCASVSAGDCRVLDQYIERKPKFGLCQLKIDQVFLEADRGFFGVFFRSIVQF